MSIEDKKEFIEGLGKIGFTIYNKWAVIELEGKPFRTIRIQIDGGYIPFGYTRIEEGDKNINAVYLATMETIEDVEKWISMLNRNPYT